MSNTGGLRRPFVCAAVGLICLIVAGPATAKEFIVRVEACGSSECNVRTANAYTNWELLSPAVRRNRQDPAPGLEPGYVVRFLLKTHDAARSWIDLRYQPRGGHLQVLGRRGADSEAPVAAVSRHWVDLDEDETAAYDELVRGLRPAVPGDAPASADGSSLSGSEVAGVAFEAVAVSVQQLSYA